MIIKSHFAKIYAFLILLSICIIISGCATPGSGPPFVFEKAKNNTAVIYHYRTSSFRGSALQWDVLSNGKPLTRIGNGGYFKQISEPGHIIYQTKDNRSTPQFVIAAISNANAEYQKAYEIDVESGKCYFLKWYVQLSDDLPLITQVSRDEAIKEIDGLLSFKPADP